MKTATQFGLTVTATAARCPVGEAIGTRNTQEGAIPVLSCEGACIRGEIARLAANRLGKAPGFRRACHGELFAVPGSTMASWVRTARGVVVIDGCPLRCHGRIVEHLVEPGRIHNFNALARYRKFTDLFDIDAVPEPERRAIAEEVAEWVQGELNQPAGAPKPAAAETRPAGSPAANGSRAGACGCTPNSSVTDKPKTHFTVEVASLVGIGAAVAANCEPCLEHHARAAERQGVSREDMGRAVALATRVKEAPSRKLAEAANRIIGAAKGPDEIAKAVPCGNGGLRASDATLGQTGSTGSSAARDAASAPPAGCATEREWT